MQTPTPKFLPYAVAVLVVVPLSGTALVGEPTGATLQPVAAVTSSEFVVVGEVIARSDTGLTLLSRGSELTTINVNRYTAIKKGAETIRLADVMVGDKVSVALTRGADGSYQAVNVAVRTGFEPRT